MWNWTFAFLSRLEQSVGRGQAGENYQPGDASESLDREKMGEGDVQPFDARASKGCMPPSMHGYSRLSDWSGSANITALTLTLR